MPRYPDLERQNALRADCQRCPALVESRECISWGNGPLDASVVVVGEAPGVSNHEGRSFMSVRRAQSSMKRTVSTDAAPAAVGAYSQATTTDDLVFTAGQIPLTPDGDLLDGADIDVQTEQALENVEAVLDEAGASLDDALKVTVYMTDIDDFEEMNTVYETFFDDEPPARSAVGVAELPKGVGVEIEAVATT